MHSGRWIVGITGASGIVYALRLLEVLGQLGKEIHVIFSEAALRVLAEEENIKTSHLRLVETLPGRCISSKLFFYNPKDIGAAVASGSFRAEGMVILPCSMGSLAAVANGICANLVHRAAEVTLKENRKLILVPRETPLSAIQLENMLKLSKAGAVILPAMPGFYHKPVTITELVDMMVMKVLDQMGIHTDISRRWGESDDYDNAHVVELEKGLN